MFDDKLFDNIMQEMMETFGAEVRTDEGSLAYNACAKIAEKLEEIYGDMDEINDNLLPDTQDDSHLIEYGRERGLEYKYATCPVVRGVFQQEIEIGERFYCNGYVYEVTELIENFNYKLTCETEGVAANANRGSLEPVDYIDDYKGGQLTDIFVAGTEDEDIESFRQKVLETFKATAFCGNKADYRKYVNAIQGVGGCKPKRREQGSPWINIYVISSDFKAPSDALIAEIQTAVDPVQSHGEGDGMAPICHQVQILAVEEIAVNLSVKIQFDTDYSEETSRSQIESIIEDYLQSLRKTWESLETDHMIVRISQIESKVLSVEGILDVSETTLNEVAANLSLDHKKIPVLGEVNISV